MKKNISKNYEKIPISKQTTNGMSFNIDDQIFIKRCFDRQDEVTNKFISDTYDEHAKLICDTVRRMLDEIQLELKSIHVEIKSINVEIKNINTEINNIRKVLIEHEFRISHIEKKLEI
jgi:septal ring factor EnvC (AmiA/AmiB activator)